jgi:alpha-tubulin suppressor-like RCC1 family protein
MEINRRLFRRLSEYFKDNIRLSYVSTFNVIIITKDDEVYQFDEYLSNENYSTIASNSDMSAIKTMINKSIVKELCFKGVVDIKSGLYHNIARTYDGKVYTWV